MLTHTRRIAILGLAVALVAGVAIAAYFYAADGRAARKSEKAAAKGPQAVLITTAVVQPRTLDIYEEVVGTIENPDALDDEFALGSALAAKVGSQCHRRTPGGGIFGNPGIGDEEPSPHFVRARPSP